MFLANLYKKTEGMIMDEVVTTSVAAKKIGVHPVTLRRWLLSGKITGIAKDRNGWWMFEPKDIRQAAEWKNYHYVPNIHRKKKS